MRTSNYTRIGNLIALFTERYTSDPRVFEPWGVMRKIYVITPTYFYGLLCKDGSESCAGSGSSRFHTTKEVRENPPKKSAAVSE